MSGKQLTAVLHEHIVGK